jgi:GDP-4-dehydro-6-deoxy-D-mannose reductase
VRVLITGANGFVGRHLARHLEVVGGHEVDWFDVSRDADDDIRDYDSVRRAIDRVQPDYVYHLAALAYVPESTTDTRRAFNINTLGTINLMEAIRQAGSDARVLVTGTSEEYGYDGHEGPITEDTRPRPTSLYGVSKLAAGLSALNYGERYGIPVVVTRTTNHTGPGQQRTYAVSAFARRVALAEKTGAPVRHGNLDAVRSYLDVHDVVDAYVRAIELPSAVYNVSTETSVTMRSILASLVAMADGPVVLDSAETLFRSANAVAPVVSSARFRGLTGWSPVVPFDETLSTTLDYWRANV